MLSKSEILITKRFLFSKKSEGYVSIFSWFSIIGIALGVAAIIIVMSVMNGFRSNLTERLLGVNSHLNLYSFNEKINAGNGCVNAGIYLLSNESLDYMPKKKSTTPKIWPG